MHCAPGPGSVRSWWDPRYRLPRFRPDRRIAFSQVSLFAVLADHDFQLAGLVDNGCAPRDRSGATRFVKRWRTEVWHSGYRIARAGDPIEARPEERNDKDEIQSRSYTEDGWCVPGIPGRPVRQG